jgi:hypothetical protein
MYRQRLEQTRAKSKEASNLKEVMLAYHDFQQQAFPPEKQALAAQLSDWQSDRLKSSHQDLYKQPEYRMGIDFLLTELYSAKDFSARDRDLERIFPKLVKLLPKKILQTVAHLVELNLLTQQLDYELAECHFIALKCNNISEESYCEAYRQCNNLASRERQLELVAEAGQMLSKHSSNSMLRFSLNITEGPAEMAGLEALHSFILRGFKAFNSMQNVDDLMHTLIRRESQILSQIYSGHSAPFSTSG